MRAAAGFAPIRVRCWCPISLRALAISDAGLTAIAVPREGRMEFGRVDAIEFAGVLRMAFAAGRTHDQKDQ